MVELVELSAGRGIIRKPDGTEVFNSDDRMPAALATIDKTGGSAISVDFPMTGLETTTGSASLQTTTAAHAISNDVVIQAYSHPVAPTFFIGEVKLSRTLIGKSTSGVGVLGAGIPEGVWLPFGGGSLFIEGEGAREYYGFNYVSGLGLSRFINFAVVGGNIVVQARQSSNGVVSIFYPPPVRSARSIWSLECRLICGFFDL